MTTSNAGNTDYTNASYMPDLPEGFYWEIRKINADAVASKQAKVFVFLKRVTEDSSQDTIAWEIVSAVDGDPTTDRFVSIGEHMLTKTSNQAALGLRPPLA